MITSICKSSFICRYTDALYYDIGTNCFYNNSYYLPFYLRILHMPFTYLTHAIFYILLLLLHKVNGIKTHVLDCEAFYTLGHRYLGVRLKITITRTHICKSSSISARYHSINANFIFKNFCYLPF